MRKLNFPFYGDLHWDLRYQKFYFICKKEGYRCIFNIQKDYIKTNFSFSVFSKRTHWLPILSAVNAS